MPAIKAMQGYECKLFENEMPERHFEKTLYQRWTTKRSMPKLSKAAF